MRKLYITFAKIKEDTVSLTGITTRAGTIWSDEEQQQLKERFELGWSLYRLAREHKRNPNGILARLKTLGLIVVDHTQECVFYNRPDTTTHHTPSLPETKESNIMTKPLEHKAFLFGSELSKLTEDQIIGHIRKATDEINSYASIPDNKYTKLRIANLQDAIEAAVKELNQRGE